MAQRISVYACLKIYTFALVSKINKINLSLSRSQLNQISVRESSFDKSTRVSMVQSLFNFSYYRISVSICIFVDLLLNFELETLTIGQFQSVSQICQMSHKTQSHKSQFRVRFTVFRGPWPFVMIELDKPLCFLINSFILKINF